MHTEVMITRWEGSHSRSAADSVAEEEPLEIRINGESLAVTMRTPGDDVDLAAGFLLAEGIVREPDEILSMAYCMDPANPDLRNIVNVYLRTGWDSGKDPTNWERRFTSTSSCGLCGKARIEAVACLSPPLPASGFKVSPDLLCSLPELMRSAQQAFDRTGGLHAAGLFDSTGRLLVLREDVGRHNAVDKVVGNELLKERLPLSDRILMVSGRASFEIMQKAAVSRTPVVCAVSAPSSLAVQLARDLNITLVGFLREDRMNIYAAPDRVRSCAPAPVRRRLPPAI